MIKTYDDIDRHIAVAGSIERAAVPPAFFMAWLVNLQLLSVEFARRAGRDVTRVRMRDLTPGEFFIQHCHGRITSAELNERGQQFVESYYHDRYLTDFDEAFGVPADQSPARYAVEDDWAHYDQLAPIVTRRFFAAGRNPPPRPRGKGLLRLITGGKKD
jgi:hypothetical protein